MAQRVKESLLPVQTRVSLLKYLAAGAPGTIRGDRVEAGPNGIESVPLDQVRTVKRLQGDDNSWPGCCSQTKHLSEKWVPTPSILQDSYSISARTKELHA